MPVLFEVLNLLNERKSHFYIQYFRPKSLTIYANFVGSRLEIEIFDDDHIEIARFDGDESIIGGMGDLHSLVQKLS